MLLTKRISCIRAGPRLLRVLGDIWIEVICRKNNKHIYSNAFTCMSKPEHTDNDWTSSVRELSALKLSCCRAKMVQD